jgi:hypothetical protein
VNERARVTVFTSERYGHSYPDGIDAQVLNCTSEPAFRHAVADFLAGRDDATQVEMGWPWPWDDSCTTDFAYAFDSGEVFASCFAGCWLNAAKYDELGTAMDESEQEVLEALTSKPAVFPNMADRKRMTLGKRSGLIVLTGA